MDPIGTIVAQVELLCERTAADVHWEEQLGSCRQRLGRVGHERFDARREKEAAARGCAIAGRLRSASHVRREERRGAARARRGAGRARLGDRQVGEHEALDGDAAVFHFAAVALARLPARQRRALERVAALLARTRRLRRLRQLQLLLLAQRDQQVVEVDVHFVHVREARLHNEEGALVVAADGTRVVEELVSCTQ